MKGTNCFFSHQLGSLIVIVYAPLLHAIDHKRLELAFSVAFLCDLTFTFSGNKTILAIIVCGFLRLINRHSCGQIIFPWFSRQKGVLILPVSKHLHKDSSIYERDPKNGKAACTYKHFTLFLGLRESHNATFHNYWTEWRRYDFMLLERKGILKRK